MKTCKPCTTKPVVLSVVAGGDLTIHWSPATAAKYEGFTWRTEFMYAYKELAMDDNDAEHNIISWGGYTYLQYRFLERWTLGIKGELLTPFSEGNADAYKWLVAPYATCHITPWVKTHLEYDYYDGSEAFVPLAEHRFYFAGGLQPGHRTGPAAVKEGVMKKITGISIVCALLLTGYAALAGEPLPPPTAQPQPRPQPVVQPAAAPAQPAVGQPAPQQSSLTAPAPAPAPQPVAQPVAIVAPVQPPKLFIVTTLTDYAGLARRIAGDLATVESLVPGVQDPSSVTPKPWFSEKLTRAQLLIATGGDAEPWLKPVIRRAGCKRFYPGQQGFVAISDGIKGRIGAVITPI